MDLAIIPVNSLLYSSAAPQSDIGRQYKILKTLASRKGIEPLTPGLGNLCSILLSYRDPDFNDDPARRLGSDPAGPRRYIGKRSPSKA